MLKTNLEIGGKSVAASGGAEFERCNPIDGKVVTRSAASSVENAIRACEAAAAAFPAWSRTGPSERRSLLLEAEHRFHANTPKFVEAMQAELGASSAWANFNVHLTCGLIREAASMTTQVAGQVVPSDIPGQMAFTQRRPVGVVLGIAPWNGPVILAARTLAMPLACGNTGILKGSELCPETHALVARSYIEAGFPPGVINYIVNAPAHASAVVSALITHDAVRRINFTGSTKTGRVIARLAGEHLKPVLLELGGKAPMVILDDADLNEAARAATFGAFMNTGQICMSTERIVVDSKVADDFVGRFVERARTLSVGDPRHSDAHLGPMAMADAPAKINALIDDAVSKGALVALAGTTDGALMSPTILDHVTPAMAIYYEESFGPVASVVRVDGVEEAVSVANDTEYGLAASVFGRDIGRAISVANRIDAGSRHVNMATIHDQPQLPFGGVKASGYGRFNGLEAIHEFTDTCQLTIRTEPAVHYPF
jgi:benzaldehyde dehydrogenase (NAD)